MHQRNPVKLDKFYYQSQLIVDASKQQQVNFLLNQSKSFTTKLK